MSNKSTTNSSFVSGNATTAVSSKISLIELVRTNTKFQNFVVKLNSFGITSDALFESDTFHYLLTDDAIKEMNNYFMEGGQSEWIKVGVEAYKQSIPADLKSIEEIIKRTQISAASLGMNINCYDCGKQVNLATKCSVSGKYHMK